MTELILLNKPYRVLSQFTDAGGRDTLAKYIKVPDFYAAGRLDYDSEGLLVLCDNGKLQQLISHPTHRQWKTYALQVEGTPDSEAMRALRNGVQLKDGQTRPAKASIIDAPLFWPRVPPIRSRANQPTSWLRISIHEGKNRQLRRMAAKVGHPVLRLIRESIGDWRLDGMQPGESRRVQVHLPHAATKKKPGRR